MFPAMTAASRPRHGLPAAAAPPRAAAGTSGAAEAIFALKSFAAAILAYWIALRIGLDRPFWAVVTCYIVAQPLAGAVLSKAVFRLVGTLVGAGVSVLLVPALVDAPELLSLALAMWLGLCTYLGLLDRTPRAYVFLLAGYSAGIVGFPAVSAPQEIFTLAAVRVQEIGIGILVSAAVHALILPRGVGVQLAARTGAMIADAERLSAAILLHRGHEVASDRPMLLRDLAALDALAVHLPYDLARLPVRQGRLHALQHQLAELLANGSAIEDRVRRLGARMPAELTRLLEDAGRWIARGCPDEGAGLIARARALEPAGVQTFEAALRLSLLDRLARLLVAHRLSRRLGAAMAQGRDLELDALARGARRPGRHRDHGAALLGAAATMLATLAGCAFWIASAWPDGANAVVYAGMICALFSNLDDPRPTARLVIAGVAAGAVAALVYRFAILPQVTDFAVLAAVLAPAFLLLSVVSQRAGLGGLAIGAILSFPGLVGFEARYDPDFTGFANIAVAELAGAWLAGMALGLVRGVGFSTRAARLLGTARAALDAKLRTPAAATEPQWSSAMLDRIGLVAGDEPESAATVLALLRLLRLGLAVDALRALAAREPARAPLVLLLLRQLRGALGDEKRVAQAQRVFVAALRRLGRGGAPDMQREGVLAVVALICNLAVAGKDGPLAAIREGDTG